MPVVPHQQPLGDIFAVVGCYSYCIQQALVSGITDQKHGGLPWLCGSPDFHNNLQRYCGAVQCTLKEYYAASNSTMTLCEPFDNDFSFLKTPNVAMPTNTKSKRHSEELALSEAPFPETYVSGFGLIFHSPFPRRTVLEDRRETLSGILKNFNRNTCDRLLTGSSSDILLQTFSRQSGAIYDNITNEPLSSYSPFGHH